MVAWKPSEKSISATHGTSSRNTAERWSKMNQTVDIGFGKV